MAVETPGLAKTFAMLVLRSASQEGVNEQLPLSVSDQGDTWLVQGSLNRDRAAEGPGPFKLEVQKRDAKVVDIGFEWVLKVPPEVQAAIGRALREREK